MARTLKSDRWLFGATLLLVGASIVMVYSASAVQMDAKYQEPYRYLIRQVAWAAIGVMLLLGAVRLDYHKYRRPAWIWTLIGIVTAGLLAVFLFHPIKGTQRWLPLGVASLQPSELAKLAAILFAAALLERRMHRVNDLAYALVPIGIVTGVFAALIMAQPDFGTAIVLLLVVGMIVFAAGLHYRYLIGVGVAMLPVAAGVIAMSSYRRQRIATFFDPWQAPAGAGFQTIQARIAVGSGGVFGKGLMNGIQKLFYIPEPHTDFIYAVIGEELGLIGTTVILACFVVIAWRGLRASVLAPDRFGALLALGLTALVLVQGFVNMSMVIGLLPTEGVPLPFVSNGGSSLVINFIGMGILLNISQQASRAAGAAVSQ